LPKGPSRGCQIDDPEKMTFSNINKDGITALELAARRKHGECVALLITNGAKTTDVSSMLLLTAECGLIDCTKQLLHGGCQQLIENGFTVCSWQQKCRCAASIIGVWCRHIR
jgi:hypothetical protein